MNFRKKSGLPTTFSLIEKLEYEFPDRHITLWFWLVERWEGKPWGKEGQPGEWMALVDLNADIFRQPMNR